VLRELRPCASEVLGPGDLLIAFLALSVDRCLDVLGLAEHLDNGHPHSLIDLTYGQHG
jgi:hypothetical protein